MGFFKADRIVLPPPAPPAQTPTTATAPAVTPQVIVIQQQPDPGISTKDGKRYMSALLAASYQAAKLLSPIGQAHLLSGTTDQQLLEDYRNGDVTSSVLTLFGIPIPKGLTQLKQSPLMTSPEFPGLPGTNPASQVVLAGGSWTFAVPQGWAYTLDTSAPTFIGVASTANPLPKNVLFSVDSVRSSRTQRSDGGWDVTVYGEWTEIGLVDAPVGILPAGMYSAVIMATLYPTDNPPPSA